MTDSERAFKICCASKKGHYVANSDIKWLEKFYNKYPNWYDENRERLFNATKPYGAN
jgi:hypothetical protein